MKQNKLRSISALATFAGVLTFTSACGAVSDNGTSPETSNTATVENTISPIPADFGTPAPAGKPISSPNGSYIQSTITDDDPAMKLNPSIVDPSLAAYDLAEIESAQRAIVTFIAEEGIDSRLNGDNNDVDSWWAENKSKIHPDYHDGAYSDLKNRKSLVLVEKWRDEYNGKYDYITDEKKTRIYDRQINPSGIWQSVPGTIAVEMNVSFSIPATPNVGATGSGIQKTTGTMTYGAAKDPASGKWLINGYANNLKTTEG